jgi:hypothetical protein
MLFVFLGCIFGFLGGLAAFFITYEEYQHHQTKKNALKSSLETGIFAFLVFLAISILVGFIFSIVHF